MTDRPLVLLATFTGMPDGEPGHAALDSALAERGLDSRWVVWDDDSVDWSAADVVAVRATWDYDIRVEEFLRWADAVGPTLLNGAHVFRWNVDKRYLLDLLDADLAVVPTQAADSADDVRRLVDDLDVAVVKPRVGAGGRGLEVVDDARAWAPSDHAGPWIVQPLVESIRTQGETSVFVLGGQAVSQVDKLPSGGEVRVHEQFGGSSRPVPLDPDAARLAVDAMAASAKLLDAELTYGRVDMLRLDGRLVVSEVELTEPGLYLDVLPDNAVPFAEAVAILVERGS